MTPSTLFTAGQALAEPSQASLLRDGIAACYEKLRTARCSRYETSVPGLYAAGDVVQSLSQISVAFGQAAIAASAVNMALNAEGL